MVISYKGGSVNLTVWVQHVEGEPVIENNVEATCTKDGSYDEVVYCSVCHEELSRDTVKINATGHTPSDWITETPATCEGAGSRYKECTVCHEVLEREEIPATGHEWGDWTQTKAPTCTEEGEEQRTCSVCGETETRPIAALDLIQKFKDEVAAVAVAQSRSERFAAICTALTTYGTLSNEEKEAVIDDYAALVAAIEAYNASAEAVNAEMNAAMEIAIKVISSAVAVAAVLAGAWFVLKRLF